MPFYTLLCYFVVCYSSLTHLLLIQVCTSLQNVNILLLFVITRFANLHLSCDAMPSVHKMLDFKYILDSMISNIILLFMVFIASDAILYPSAKC